jgi:hypothetical protein
MIVVQRSRLFLGPFHEESAYKRVGSMTCADRIVLMQTVQNISCFFLRIHCTGQLFTRLHHGLAHG